MASGAFLRKLSVFADLNAEELALLSDLTHDVRMTGDKRDIICEGDRPDHLHLIVSGWAAR